MAARYWVGGTAAWDATAGTKWAATSGGAGGQTVPGAADTVFFDANSGANTVTLGSGYNPVIVSLTMTGFTGTLAFGSQNISLNGTGTIYAGATTFSATGNKVINCTNSSSTARTVSPTAVTEANAISFNITAGTGTVTLSAGNYLSIDFTGFSGTLGSAARTIYGNLTFSPTMTATGGAGGTITFAATSGTQLVTFNGITYDSPITQNSPGATLQLQNNLTMGSTRTFTLTAGTLDLNNRTLSTGLFNSNNSNTRSIAFGTGNITLTGSGATIFTASTATNLTITGTPVVNCTYSGGIGTRQINGGATSILPEAQAINFNITAGTDTFSLGGSNCFKNVDFTGFKGTVNSSSATAVTIYGNLTFDSGCNPSFAGGATLTFASTSGTNTITCAGTTIGTNIAFTGLGGTWQFADALTLASTKTINFTNGTLKLKAGVTSTVYGFTASGTNQKYLQSTLAGSQATLSEASGTINASYLTIQDINATGGATWNAFVDQGNIDAGNNDGWDFGISPVVGGAEYTYALRSFTQPRRF